MKSRKKVAFASFIMSTIMLGGCGWDASTYEEVVNTNNSITTCDALEFIIIHKANRISNSNGEPKQKDLLCFKTEAECEKYKQSEYDCEWNGKNNSECNSFKTSFKYDFCPAQYYCHTPENNCSNDNKLCKNTYCDNKEKQCAENTISCKDDNNILQCISPLDPNHCGATDCKNLGKSCPINQTCQQEGDSYVCKDAQVCQDNTIRCQDENGKLKCISPLDSKYCGAIDCENLGKECPNSKICNKDGDKYECKDPQVCADNTITCQNDDESLKCIDPNNNETCGATSCKNTGEKCEENRSCHSSTTDGKTTYSCQCNEGLVQCGNNCINPVTDPQYCGADAQCQNYEICKEEQVCNGIKCVCREGGYYYNGKCSLPSANETCGLQEDGSGWEICKDGKECVGSQETGYKCMLTKCDSKINPIPCNVDGELKCVNDVNNCGGCGIKCKDQVGLNQSEEGIKCNDKGECEIPCSEGYQRNANCKDPTICYKENDSKHCGSSCKACAENEYCENGECLESKCRDADAGKCMASTETLRICVAQDDACGVNCENCENKGRKCVNNKCTVPTCNDGEHPVFDEDGDKIDCEQNNILKCGSKNANSSDEIISCEENKPAYVSEMSCNNARCEIKHCKETFNLVNNLCECNGVIKDEVCIPFMECKEGEHQNEERTQCRPNSLAECAPPNWDGSGSYHGGYVKDCGTASGVICTNEGVCGCQNNYILNETLHCIPNCCKNTTGADYITEAQCITVNQNRYCSISACQYPYINTINSNKHLCQKVTIDCTGKNNKTCEGCYYKYGHFCLTGNSIKTCHQDNRCK